ncbi:MAG: NUDIX hydrolase [Salibacteraceae bacterium]
MGFKQEIYVAADNIVINPKNEVLLICRKNDPFKDKWAFPGGFVEKEEELNQAAVRELNEETGLNIDASEAKLVKTIGTVGRDPRFRTVSVVFLIHLNEEADVVGADDAAEARWFDLNSLPLLAFDHSKILETVLADEVFDKSSTTETE